MMFLINAIYTFVSVVFMLLPLLLIQYLGPVSNWGYISHNLLMLDVRKDHVKFWPVLSDGEFRTSFSSQASGQ